MANKTAAVDMDIATVNILCYTGGEIVAQMNDIWQTKLLSVHMPNKTTVHILSVHLYAYQRTGYV